MLQLLSHLVSLFVKLLNFELSRSNFSLELLDLVVQDELELLKFLGLLL